MKNRICLAWFCDLDSPDQGRKKSRSAASRETPARQPVATPRGPRVKQGDEQRRMPGPR
jgi:hypothetical protein